MSISRDNALDWVRALSLSGIVAAHTLTNRGSLPFAIGNGIAPIAFAAIMGATLVIVPMSYRRMIVSSVILFLIGVILELTPTYVLPILMTFGVIYPILWVVVTKTKWWVGLTIGLVGSLTPPLLYSAIPSIDTAYVPFRDGGNWLGSLFLYGTYPVATWWFIPILGYYAFLAVKNFSLARIMFTVTGITCMVFFIVFHYVHGPEFTGFGDVSHILRPISGPVVGWWFIPYGHTGSILSVFIGVTAVMAIYSILARMRVSESLLGRNTMTAYTLNVLMATSPSMFGDWTIYASEMVVIVGGLYMWKAAMKTSRGPIEIITGFAHRAADSIGEPVVS